MSAQQKEDRLFENIYLSYFPKMKRFAQEYVISEQDAENIVQDMFAELWEKREEYEINCDTLAQLIYKIANQHEVDGFTITGGEPMNQAEALQSLLPELRKINPDILVYSGYTLEELRGLKSTAVETVLRQIAVLIDGAYIEERNTDALLRGSDNQKIWLLDEQQRGRYAAYMEKAHNQIQNFTGRDGIISVGIHKPGFMNELTNIMNKD